MEIKDYVSLGVSNQRDENSKDHEILQSLMDSRWTKIRDFYLNSYDYIRTWQLHRIKELVTHAFNNVPLYRKKYSAVGFEPGDLKTWEDFESLPILTKDELIDGFPKHSVSRLHNLEFTTRSSGSSGRFVTVAVSPDAIYIDTIQGARQFHFQSGGNYHETDLALFVAEIPWWFESINGKYPTKCVNLTGKLNDIIASIEKSRPHVLSMYPSQLLKFREAEIDLNKNGTKLIVVHSEQSDQNVRIDLSNYFSIPVFDEFSSEELTRMALECPNRNYHLEEDACYIEIVDPKSNKNLPLGERGLVVGTNLLNEATPIIRYIQSDVASINPKSDCTCRSNFRIMSSPEGRYLDSIVLSNGDYVPSGCVMGLAYFWYIKRAIPVHGVRYQIVQNRCGDIDIYLTRGTYDFNEDQRNSIKELMYDMIPRDVPIRVHEVDEVPYINGKKFRPIISFKER